MTVQECMDKMSYKEYKVWVEKIKQEIRSKEDDFYTHSLTDLYLLKLAMETRLVRYAVLRIPKVPEWEQFVISKEKSVVENKNVKNIQTSNVTSQVVWQQRIPRAQIPDFEKWQKSQISSSDS